MYMHLGFCFSLNIVLEVQMPNCTSVIRESRVTWYSLDSGYWAVARLDAPEEEEAV